MKVLDFGLAKAVQGDGALSGDLSPSNTPTLTGRATAMGSVLGTGAYVAPEQARGKAVDKRADIWAYGAVLFEMLTGRRLFEGRDLAEVVAAVISTEPDLVAPAVRYAGLGARPDRAVPASRPVDAPARYRRSQPGRWR